MVAGDLVYIRPTLRNASDTVGMTVTGGQTWNSPTARQGNTLTSYGFYCIYNGTWAADPTFDGGSNASGALTIFGSVFRPTSGFAISLDVAEEWATFTAPSGPPYDVTRAGQTATASSVTIAEFCTTNELRDWTLQTGGWVNAGNPEYGNTTGTGLSISRAYLIQASGGATGSVVNRQDSSINGAASIITFKETAVAGQPTFIRGRGVIGMNHRSLFGRGF